MKDDDFAFNHCPECGSTSLRKPNGFWCGGKGAICNDCGKEWHVILEDEETQDDEPEKD